MDGAALVLLLWVMTACAFVGGVALVRWALRRWGIDPDIPTPEENERRRQQVSEQCRRHNERLERDAAKEAWAELKPRVVKAITSNVMVEIAVERQNHLGHFNAELAKRGWVLEPSAPGVPWFHVRPLENLPIPAVPQQQAESLPRVEVTA